MTYENLVSPLKLEASGGRTFNDRRQLVAGLVVVDVGRYDAGRAAQLGRLEPTPTTWGRRRRRPGRSSGSTWSSTTAGICAWRVDPAALKPMPVAAQIAATIAGIVAGLVVVVVRLA